MAKKTVNINELRVLFNDMLNNSMDEMIEYRFGLCGALDVLLQSTGNYKGYQFIPGSGISEDGENTVLDSSRRYYN